MSDAAKNAARRRKWFRDNARTLSEMRQALDDKTAEIGRLTSQLARTNHALRLATEQAAVNLMHQQIAVVTTVQWSNKADSLCRDLARMTLKTPTEEDEAIPF